MAKENLPKNFIGIDALNKVAEQVNRHYFFGLYTAEELLDENVSPEERAKRDAVIERLQQEVERDKQMIKDCNITMEAHPQTEMIRQRKSNEQSKITIEEIEQ